jgi:hypothetical protein
MGKRALLVEVPPEVFERIQISGEVQQKEFGKNTFLDTAWLQLNQVFENASPPLCFAISGDFHPSYSPKDLDAFIHQNINPYYISFTSPETVTRIAEMFTAFSEAELAFLTDKVNVDLDDAFNTYFSELRNAYIFASLNGNAISIIIA